MYILILILTLIPDQPYASMDEESANSRCWTVSTPADAAILIYQNTKKAKETNQRFRAKLVGLDTENMRAEEVEIPTLTFGFNRKPDCTIIATNCVNFSTFVTIKKEESHARK